MKKLGSIESYTGGLFASTIISKPGASSFFKGSLITYSNDLKEKLGVETANGVINKETALQMSKKGKEFLGVDVCVSFTGNAGPSTMEEKEVGLVYIAINEEVFELNIKGNRDEVRRKSVEFAISELNKMGFNL